MMDNLRWLIARWLLQAGSALARLAAKCFESSHRISPESEDKEEPLELQSLADGCLVRELIMLVRRQEEQHQRMENMMRQLITHR